MRCTDSYCNPTQATAKRDGAIGKYNEEDNQLVTETARESTNGPTNCQSSTKCPLWDNPVYIVPQYRIAPYSQYWMSSVLITVELSAKQVLRASTILND